MLNDLERIRILGRFLNNIEIISEENFLKGMLVSEECPKVDGFTKKMRLLFEDVNSILENYKDFWVANDQRQILVKFKEKFERFLRLCNSRGNQNRKFIVIPEWAEIVVSAKDILLIFEYKNGLTGEARRNILKGYLENIQHISNREYQKRVWIRGEGPECDDFDETVNHYSSDAEEILGHYKDYSISDTQLLVMRRFHDKFKEFWKDNDFAPFFIDTSEWTRITVLAKEVLEMFSRETRNTLEKE